MTCHERQFEDRVDGSHLEPGHGLHLGIAGVRPLLRHAPELSQRPVLLEYRRETGP